jgi:hypothetical protein
MPAKKVYAKSDSPCGEKRTHLLKIHQGKFQNTLGTENLRHENIKINFKK